ncbi:MAG TPA: hypothetical protein VIO38_05950 [Rariglobus sp.]
MLKTLLLAGGLLLIVCFLAFILKTKLGSHGGHNDKKPPHDP